MSDRLRSIPLEKASLPKVERNVFLRNELETPNDFIDYTYELYTPKDYKDKDFYYSAMFDKIRMTDPKSESGKIMAHILNDKMKTCSGKREKMLNKFDGDHEFDNIFDPA